MVLCGVSIAHTPSCIHGLPVAVVAEKQVRMTTYGAILFKVPRLAKSRVMAHLFEDVLPLSQAEIRSPASGMLTLVGRIRLYTARQDERIRRYRGIPEHWMGS